MTTTPAVWAEAIDRHAVAPMPVPTGRVVAVAAHPDDETLGAAGLLRLAGAAGADVELVVATDGEAAFGAPDPELGRTRHSELRAALHEIGLGEVVVHRLGMPDSGLAGCIDELTDALVPLLSAADFCLAPWVGDPHPDHAAAAAATRAAAPVRAHRFGYPIWTLPWRTPEDADLPWPHAGVLTLDPDTRAAKRRAIGRFASQLSGEHPVLSADVLAHFHGPRELYVRSPPTRSAPVGRFAELYAADPDPWRTRTSWYERRKRDVVLACLPRARYRHAAEPGCGTGALTAALAARCGRVTASDPVPAAVVATRAATAGRPGVAVLDAALPEDRALPADVDLVVLSEVLYYLAPDDVAQIADRIPPGADVVLVHWRAWPAEAPQDAAATHRQLHADRRFATLVEHVDEEFLLHVLRRRRAP